MRRQFAAAFLTALLCMGVAARSVYAAQTSEELLKQQEELHAQGQKLEQQKKAAEQEQNAAQSGLAQARDSIREITGEREMVGEAISDLTDDLVSLLATIAMIEEQIVDTEEQIADTQAAYDEAKRQEDAQYAAMKARAKFMYEKGDQDMIVLLLQSESISDFLNRATYVQELHDYDRRELDTFIRTKEEAEALGEALEEAKAELEADHFELEQSQTDMETILAELQEQAENYDVMLAHAKQDAAAYQMKIRQQASAIDRLASQIQAKAAEEAEMKKAAEEAKAREEEEKRKAEEAKRKAEEEMNGITAETSTSNASSTSATSVPASYGIADFGTSASEESAASEEAASESSASTDGSSKSASASKTYAAPGSATGSNIASYACQFVGNPYVAGGTSLTNGCDCSGFTMAVYQAFGISIPRTSWSQQRVGREVSLESAQPGDIVCYAGHVAIYIGNGQIVHASTQKSGIKYGNVNYKTIITIRRVV